MKEGVAAEPAAARMTVVQVRGRSVGVAHVGACAVARINESAGGATVEVLGADDDPPYLVDTVVPTRCVGLRRFVDVTTSEWPAVRGATHVLCSDPTLFDLEPSVLAAVARNTDLFAAPAELVELAWRGGDVRPIAVVVVRSPELSAGVVDGHLAAATQSMGGWDALRRFLPRSRHAV